MKPHEFLGMVDGLGKIHTNYGRDDKQVGWDNKSYDDLLKNYDTLGAKYMALHEDACKPCAHCGKAGIRVKEKSQQEIAKDHAEQMAQMAEIIKNLTAKVDSMQSEKSSIRIVEGDDAK